MPLTGFGTGAIGSQVRYTGVAIIRTPAVKSLVSSAVQLPQVVAIITVSNGSFATVQAVSGVVAPVSEYRAASTKRLLISMRHGQHSPVLFVNATLPFTPRATFICLTMLSNFSIKVASPAS